MYIRLSCRQGRVAQIRFVPSPSNYTGLFSSGDEFAIIRLSLAKAPTADNIVPAIAMKYFRDGVESANWMSMYSLQVTSTCSHAGKRVNQISIFSPTCCPTTSMPLQLSPSLCLQKSSRQRVSVTLWLASVISLLGMRAGLWTSYSYP